MHSYMLYFRKRNILNFIKYSLHENCIGAPGCHTPLCFLLTSVPGPPFPPSIPSVYFPVLFSLECCISHVRTARPTRPVVGVRRGQLSQSYRCSFNSLHANSEHYSSVIFIAVFSLPPLCRSSCSLRAISDPLIRCSTSTHQLCRACSVCSTSTHQVLREINR
jgi:hypothetical protein